MKRFKLRNKAYKVSSADITEFDDQATEDKWLLKTERIQLRQFRRFKQQLSA